MDCMKGYIETARFADTGFSYTMSLINGKHKMVILYCLMEYEPVRFNEMKRYLGNITDKTLSSNLKQLEADRLIVRKEYPQIPPKVEYSLSERGKSLMKVLDLLCLWGEQNRIYGFPIVCPKSGGGAGAAAHAPPRTNTVQHGPSGS